jgi:phosphohistidine phosphatase
MTITLIRHAKSSWDYNVIDHDRPLSARGISDAQLVFSEFKKTFQDKGVVFSSTSKRTSQTAKVFCSILTIDIDKILFKQELYTFNSSDLEKIIKSNLHESLIIFGHNNAITDFVNKFGNYYIENVPTCGIVILKFEESNTITPKKGVIIKTIFPRDLKK